MLVGEVLRSLGVPRSWQHIRISSQASFKKPRCKNHISSQAVQKGGWCLAGADAVDQTMMFFFSKSEPSMGISAAKPKC